MQRKTVTPCARIDYIDWLRALACMAVIMLHSADPYAFKLEDLSLFSSHFAPVLIHKTFMWAVPVFFMITGALLIRPEKTFNARYFITRRLQKVVVPVLCWSVFYCLLKAYDRQQGYFNWMFFLDNVLAIPLKPQFGHLWFFYAYIPALFFIPAMQYVIKRTDNELVLFYLWVWLFFCLIYTLIDPTPWMLSCRILMYVGYMLLGYMLFCEIGTNALSGKRAFVIFATGLIFYLVRLCFDIQKHGQPVRPQAGYFFLFVVLEAIAVFWLCKTYLNFDNKIIQSISRNSLGIYLAHFAVLAVIGQKVAVLSGGGVVVTIMLTFAITFIVSWLITEVLYRMKVTRFLVP